MIFTHFVVRFPKNGNSYIDRFCKSKEEADRYTYAYLANGKLARTVTRQLP
jgi:hypothetical protein